MAVYMPAAAESVWHPPAGFIEHPVVRCMVPLEPGENLADPEFAVIDRNTGPGHPAHQAEPRLRPVRGAERRWPRPVDQRVIEIIDRPVRIEVATREYGANQGCAEIGCGAVEFVDISVFGGAQHLQWAVELKFLGITRPTVR